MTAETPQSGASHNAQQLRKLRHDQDCDQAQQAAQTMSRRKRAAQTATTHPVQMDTSNDTLFARVRMPGRLPLLPVSLLDSHDTLWSFYAGFDVKLICNSATLSCCMQIEALEKQLAGLDSLRSTVRELQASVRSLASTQSDLQGEVTQHCSHTSALLTHLQAQISSVVTAGPADVPSATDGHKISQAHARVASMMEGGSVMQAPRGIHAEDEFPGSAHYGALAAESELKPADEPADKSRYSCSDFQAAAAAAADNHEAAEAAAQSAYAASGHEPAGDCLAHEVDPSQRSWTDAHTDSLLHGDTAGQAEQDSDTESMQQRVTAAAAAVFAPTQDDVQDATQSLGMQPAGKPFGSQVPSAAAGQGQLHAQADPVNEDIEAVAIDFSSPLRSASHRQQSDSWRDSKSSGQFQAAASQLASLNADDVHSSRSAAPFPEAHSLASSMGKENQADASSAQAGPYPKSAPQQSARPHAVAGAASQSTAGAGDMQQNKYLRRLQWPPVQSLMSERAWLHEALEDTLNISQRSSDSTLQAAMLTTAGQDKEPLTRSGALAAMQHGNYCSSANMYSSPSWRAAQSPAKSMHAALPAMDTAMLQPGRKLGGLAFGGDAEETAADTQGVTLGKAFRLHCGIFLVLVLLLQSGQVTQQMLLHHPRTYVATCN